MLTMIPQLAGQRKKDDTDSMGSSFVGLRTPYWG